MNWNSLSHDKLGLNTIFFVDRSFSQLPQWSSTSQDEWDEWSTGFAAKQHMMGPASLCLITYYHTISHINSQFSGNSWPTHCIDFSSLRQCTLLIGLLSAKGIVERGIENTALSVHTTVSLPWLVMLQREGRIVKGHQI